MILGSRDRLIHLLTSYASDGGAVCYSTHVLGDVSALGATLAVIDRGVIVARGPLQGLLTEHGRSSLALRFDGPPPPTACAVPGAKAHGPWVRIPCDEPTACAAALIARLGPEIGRLTALDVIKPSLESIFFSITGQTMASENDEVVDDAALFVAP